MYMCMYCGIKTNGDTICKSCQKELMKINCEKMDEMIKQKD